MTNVIESTTYVCTGMTISSWYTQTPSIANSSIKTKT